MPLQIYNSLSRKKEEFKPLHKDHVGMYVCGPTVYGHSHVGHAKSYVSFDVIVRYLRYLGYNVTYVQNITDVGHLLGDTDEGEDRMLRQSKLEQKHPMEIAEFYTRSYFQDMDALGLLRPDISPRATGHIIEQVELVKTLISRGCAYEANGSVYFDVSKDPDYGKLSGRSTDEAEPGKRIEVKKEKRHPNDFALWKKAEPEHIMRWPSPWGVGFPGWHIECSAMSMKYLGETFDIHGGGLDNQFPHHECEIAQSECATGKPFVRYWIHNNLVTANGQKMSKSVGNVILLKDIFKQHNPFVVRFFILQSHYRSTLDFTQEALQGSAKGLEKLNQTLRNIRTSLQQASTPRKSALLNLELYKKQFLTAMEDDFNTPQAIAVLFDLSKDVNSALDAGELNNESIQRVDALFGELGGAILGIVPAALGPLVSSRRVVYDPIGSKTRRESSTDGTLETELIELILDLRSEVRAKKLWALSDTIRDRLNKLGIVVEDKKEGIRWRRT